MEPQPTRRTVPTTALLVLLGTAVHLVVWVGLPGDLGANESSDLQLFYEPVARSIVDGDGLVTTDGEAAVRYPPGFPVLLAPVVALSDAAGVQLSTLLALLTAATMGLSAGVLHLVGRRLLGAGPALVGTLLWICWPLNLWLAKQPNSEVPFTLLLLLAVLATVRAAQAADPRGDALLAGLALGAATLVRPAGLLLVVPLAGWAWWQRRGAADERAWATPARVAATMALVLLPWVVWASAATDELVPVSAGGRDTVMDGLEVGIGEKGTEEGRSLAMPAELRALLEDLSAQDGDGELPTTGSIVVAVAGEVPERPVAVAELVVMKAARSWYGTESLRYERLLVVLQVGTAVLLVVGAVRCWRGGHDRRQAVVLIGAVLLTAWLQTMAVISLVRYLTPALGLALLLGGVALEPLAARVPWLRSRGRAGVASATMPTTEGADPVATGGS